MCMILSYTVIEKLNLNKNKNKKKEKKGRNRTQPKPLGHITHGAPASLKIFLK